jgi:DNA polymerase-4
VKTRALRRSILHVDLDPFFVSVERSLDPTLRGQAVVVGGGDAGGLLGIVAAASDEARRAGVYVGQPLAAARRICPNAAFRPGDLDTYARFSQDVSTLLLEASRRVERPSADEAFVDLTLEHPHAPSPVSMAERLKDELQRKLGLDAALGLASSRLAAQVASRWARPRGLVVVLPGYESSFLASQPVARLPELPTHLESALQRAGFETLGQVAQADIAALSAAVGATTAERLQAAAQGLDEQPVAVTAPPSWIHEETLVRSRTIDREGLDELLESLVGRALRRLRPFGLQARTLTVEVRRAEGALRRSQDIPSGVSDEATVREVVRGLAQALLEPAGGVRGLQVRLARLARPPAQAALFPGTAARRA